jgi:hypothetical protein
MVHITALAIASLADQVESFFATEYPDPFTRADSFFDLKNNTFTLFVSTDPSETAPLYDHPDFIPGWHILHSQQTLFQPYLDQPNTYNVAALLHFTLDPATNGQRPLINLLTDFNARLVDFHIHTQPHTQPKQEVAPGMPLTGSLQQCLKFASVLFEQHNYEILHVLFHLDPKHYQLYTTAELNKAGSLGQLERTRHTLCITRYELAQLLPAPAIPPERAPEPPIPSETE